MEFFPEQASSVAPQVDNLLFALIALSGFFTTIVVAMIFYLGIKYRRGSDANRENAPTTSLRVELGWIFGLLILAAGTYVWSTIIYYRITRPPVDALDIYVVGLQWMWKIQHPQGNTEVNELHVPVDTNVRLIMTSEDVIHSFYIPNFRLKYDAIPGRYTTLWFEATEPGVYPFYCSEFCGTEHSKMIGQVFVMEVEDYQQWLQGGGSTDGGTGEQPGGSVGGEQISGSMAEAGAAIFGEQGCGSCHAAGSEERAPDLTGIFGQEEEMADGSLVVVDENYLRESIVAPLEKIVAGYDPIMPSYQSRLSEEEITQLIEYIKSLTNEE